MLATQTWLQVRGTKAIPGRVFEYPIWRLITGLDSKRLRFHRGGRYCSVPSGPPNGRIKELGRFQTRGRPPSHVQRTGVPGKLTMSVRSMAFCDPTNPLFLDKQEIVIMLDVLEARHGLARPQ